MRVPVRAKVDEGALVPCLSSFVFIDAFRGECAVRAWVRATRYSRGDSSHAPLDARLCPHRLLAQSPTRYQLMYQLRPSS